MSAEFLIHVAKIRHSRFSIAAIIRHDAPLLVECWSSAAQDNKFDTLTLRHFDTLTAKINPDAHYENQIRLTIKIKRKEGR